MFCFPSQYDRQPIQNVCWGLPAKTKMGGTERTCIPHTSHSQTRWQYWKSKWALASNELIHQSLQLHSWSPEWHRSWINCCHSSHIGRWQRTPRRSKHGREVEEVTWQGTPVQSNVWRYDWEASRHRSLQTRLGDCFESWRIVHRCCPKTTQKQARIKAVSNCPLQKEWTPVHASSGWFFAFVFYHFESEPSILEQILELVIVGVTF